MDHGSEISSSLAVPAHRYAPQDKVAEIQKRCGLKPHKLRLHKGIRTRGAAAKTF